MLSTFYESLKDAEHLSALYQHCTEELALPGDHSDLLRMSWVYILSAFDKLIHELIVYETVEIFKGKRLQTPKYLSDSISLEQLHKIKDSTHIPAEIAFRQHMQHKLSHLSFMDPAKLAEGLALVWSEPQKWQAIAAKLDRDEKLLKVELRNIVKRRNAIVHEGDRDPSTSEKLPISVEDAKAVGVLVENLGTAIRNLI